MLLQLILLFASIGFSAGLDTLHITADIKVELPNGYYNGKMYYKYDGSGLNKHYLKLEYTKPTTMSELIDYSEGVKYKVCGSTCEAEYYTFPVPILAKQIGDAFTNTQIGRCKRYSSISNPGVKAVWFTDGVWTPCKVELADGRTLNITNVNKATIADKVFQRSTSCPEPVCKRVMDLVFVVDISGSVGSRNWYNIIKPFMKNLINSFDIGSDATQIGIITYGTTARKVLGLSNNKNSIINALDGASYTGGNTCTGCGINMGMSFLNNTATHRKSLDPEKIMIVMTDGVNQQKQGTPCSDYRSQCTKRGNKCIKKTCSTGYRTVTTSICAERGPSTRCKRYQCDKCASSWGACINQTCKTYGSGCIRYNTSYCTAAYPPGCTVSKGNLYSATSNNVRCICSQYQCIEKNCTSYTCHERACDSCSQRSTTICSEYETECKRYATNQVCDGTESCIEYECLAGKAVCNKTTNTYRGMLTGAIILTRTEWALWPATKRLPIVIAIGVGSISKNELYAIASTLEGKQFMYTVNDFNSLSTLFSDLIDETCINQVNFTDSCGSACKGFCGCNKQCYCPTCDTPEGSCYTIGCTTANKKSTQGCIIKHVDCTTPNNCKNTFANNKTRGCCSYTDKSCTTTNKCMIPYCNEAVGCMTKPVSCLPPTSCFNFSSCDPASGCKYKSACPSLGPCKIMTCTPKNKVDFTCTYTDKCTSNDPCMLPYCDGRTGACSLKPMKCVPQNRCNQAKCYNGVCVEETNVTKKILCANKATSSCNEGYCDPTDGECKVRAIIDSNCGNCDQNNTLKCSSKSNKCYTYKCAAGSADGSKYPTKCVKEATVANENPCVTMECTSGEIGWKSTNKTKAAKDRCHEYRCTPDPDDPTKAKWEEISYLDPEADGKCRIAYCTPEGTPAVREYCQPKNCSKLLGCEIDAKGNPKCNYEPIVCEENRCTRAFCNEATNQCEYYSNASECDPHNPCQTFECFNETGCQIYDVSCDDGTNCTEDKCVPIVNASGAPNGTYTSEEIERGYVCTHTLKCETPGFCWTPICNDEGGCSSVPYNCEDMNENSTLDSCRTYTCDEATRSCKVTLLPAAFLDVCGSCVKIYAEHSSFSEEFEKVKCIGKMKMPDFAAAISGAALAAIIIAAIIVAAILAVSSTLATKELIKRAKKNADTGTNNNPLYEANDNESSNPAYMDGK